MKKQLKLFEPFFNEELDYKNDYVSYINITQNKVTSVIHHNIKKLLKTKKFITISTPKQAFKEIKQANIFRNLYLSAFKNLSGLKLQIERSKFVA